MHLLDQYKQWRHTEYSKVQVFLSHYLILSMMQFEFLYLITWEQGRFRGSSDEQEDVSLKIIFTCLEICSDIHCHRYWSIASLLLFTIHINN